MYECVIQISPLERVARGQDKISERGLFIIYNQTEYNSGFTHAGAVGVSLCSPSNRAVRSRTADEKVSWVRRVAFGLHVSTATYRKCNEWGRKAYKRVCNSHTVHTKATNRTSKFVAKLGTANVTKLRTMKIILGGIQLL